MSIRYHPPAPYMNTKAQLTLIIILGIVLLMVAGIIIFYGNAEQPKKVERRTDEQKKWIETLQSSQKFFQNCFEEGVYSGIDLIAKQGGVIYASQGGMTPDATPIDSVQYEEHSVRYDIVPPKGKAGSLYFAEPPKYPWTGFPYVEKDGKTLYWWYGYYGISKLPPLYENFTGSIQENMVTYLTNYLESVCAKDFIASTNEATMTWIRPRVNMSVASDTEFVLARGQEPESIIFTAELPAEIRNDDFRAPIGQASISPPVRLSKVYYFARELIEKDTTDINFSLQGFFPHNMRVSVIPRGSADIITVTDELSTLNTKPFELRFARQNRAPALYELCTPQPETFLCPGSIIITKNISQLPPCEPIYPPCSQPTNESDLVLRLTFDKPITNEKTEDTSGKENHGGTRGPRTLQGQCAGSLGFDGDDLVSMKNTPSLSSPGAQFTAEAWLNFYDITTNQDLYTPTGYISVLSKWEDTNRGTAGWFLGLGGGSKPLFAISTTGTDRIIAQGHSPLKSRKWYHIAGTYDGKSVRVYIDGQQVGSAPATGAIFQTPASVMVGAYDFKPPVSFFRGTIDEARIYSRALTPEEIRSHYTKGLDNKQIWELPKNKTSKETPHIIIDNPPHCGADFVVPLAAIDTDEDAVTFRTKPPLPKNISARDTLANTATGYTLTVYAEDPAAASDYQSLALPVKYSILEIEGKEKTEKATPQPCKKLDANITDPSIAASSIDLCRWVCPTGNVYDCTEACKTPKVCGPVHSFATVAWSQRLLEAHDDCANDDSPSDPCSALRRAIIGLKPDAKHIYSLDNPEDTGALH